MKSILSAGLLKFFIVLESSVRQLEKAERKRSIILGRAAFILGNNCNEKESLEN